MDRPATTPSAHRVVATAGHVDHGKSTLVHALTGMEPDRLAEERRRGLTIELGYAWTTLSDPAEVGRSRTVAFVDVPGHERFVATMLAGAGAAPTALLVVAADDGWSRQTTEHRDVLALLRVPAVAIAVTKADLVDDGRIDEVVARIDTEVAGTTLAQAPVIVTDAVSGRGLDRLRASAYRRLAELAAPPDHGRPRLWVDRTFSVRGAGTVVTGTLADGRLAVDDDVEVVPTGGDLRGRARARVRGLQSLGRPVVASGPGTRVAANLAGLEPDQVERGDAVVGSGPWRVTDVADLWVHAVEHASVARTGAWHLHVGSTSTTCRVAPFAGDALPGAQGAVRVRLDHPLPLVAGDRVVLRDVGPRVVAAGGIVVDAAPVARPRGEAARVAHAAKLEDLHARAADDGPRAPGSAPSVERWLAGSLDLAGGSRPTELAHAAVGWPADRPTPAGIVEVGHHLVLATERDRWCGAVRGLGPGTHDRAAVGAAALAAGAPQAAAHALTDHLVDLGVLVRISGGVALADHVDDATRAREQRADRLVDALLAEPFSPPDLDVLVREHGLDRREVTALVGSGRIVRCGQVTFARAAIDRAVEALRPLAAGDTAFTASQAKAAWGTTRRYAIPLLEHLDRTGVTRFDGQTRRLLR